jgi:hypothetical protein
VIAVVDFAVEYLGRILAVHRSNCLSKENAVTIRTQSTPVCSLIMDRYDNSWLFKLSQIYLLEADPNVVVRGLVLIRLCRRRSVLTTLRMKTADLE